MFIDLVGFGIILPLLPFIAEKFSANALQIGLLGAAYSLFQFISAPILGRLSDRYGRKRTLIVSQLGSMAGYILLGVAGSLPLLFLSRIIDGATGGNISIAQAYIADVTTTKDRAKGMGVIGAAFGLGFILGPAIGGLLSKFGFAAPAFFAAAVSLVTVTATALFLKETVNTEAARHSPRSRFNLQEFKKVISIYPMGLLIVVFFLANLAFSGMQGTFALWAQDTLGWGPTQIGYIFAYIGVLAVITQLKILPVFIKHFGEKLTLKLSLPLLALGLLLIPLARYSWALLLISNGLLVFGNSLANPTIQAIASENVDKNEYGGTLGFLQSGASLGRILGPAIGGELYFALGKDTPFYSSGAIMILASIIVTYKLVSTPSLWQRLARTFAH